MSDGLPMEEALLVMDIDLRAGGHLAPSNQCHLHARFHDGRDVRFSILPGMRRYFWSAPAGRYEMKYMSCGMFSRFELDGYPAFTSRKGETYYFGLKTIIIESRESMQWSFEDMSRERLLTQFLSMPDSVQHKIVSAFSLRPITEDLIRKTPLGPQVKVLKGSLDSVKSGTWPFSKCLGEETRRNPLRAGLYHLRLIWEERGDPLIEVLESNHLYTKSFDSCLKETIKSWGDELSRPIVLELTL